MKRYSKYSAVVILVAIVASCLEFLNINHPETAQVNSTVEASFEISVEVDELLAGDPRSTLLVGILAPVSWNPSTNFTVTYSSQDMPGGPVSDMPMRLVTDADLDADGLTWPAAMSQKLGTQENYEPVQWVVFIAENQHTWDGGDKFTGTVDVKFNTGSENIRTNLAYFIGNAMDGVNDDSSYYLLYRQTFETTGGSNSLIDYTSPKMCYVTPEAFTWEDIVAINFDPTIQVEGEDSPLLGEDEVYMMATATYDSGSKEVVVDEISQKTLMTLTDDVYKLYIYPHEYFGISAGTVIEKITFYFVNKDKSVTVMNPGTGEPFTVDENNI